MKTWEIVGVNLLEKLKKYKKISTNEIKAINNIIHILKYGKGWLTGDMPSKIFFFSDFYNENTNKENKEGENMISKHEDDYKNNAWKEYSMLELGLWVHLLYKRAGHRQNKEKMKKDIYDAKNYLTMMEEKLSELENNVSK